MGSQRGDRVGVFEILGARLGLDLELLKDLVKISVGGFLGVVEARELALDGGEQIVDVQEVEDALIDGDKDEA